jgi:protein-S-isoprenylcysteine O-methyltransferase Ste14
MLRMALLEERPMPEGRRFYRASGAPTGSKPDTPPSSLNEKSRVTKQAIAGLAALAVVLWLALFVPAGTLGFWQGWAYWLIFMSCVTAISVYFMRGDLTLIENRLKTGPGAETGSVQKLAQVLISLFFVLLILIPALDHRFGWSSVPAYLVVLGDAFTAIGLAVIFLVFRENSHASAAIKVNEGQEVVSTGLYSAVRHPMYAGALIMLLFTPLALGSFWGLIPFLGITVAIALRIYDEEKFLAKNLRGYDEYRRKVRFRLIPYVW